MKSIFFFIIALLFNIGFVQAQQGINYKALIKDDLGNVVANQSINVRFTILTETGLHEVYKETHTGINTDVNGIVIVNIGTIIQKASISDIDWGRDNHLLKVEIDIEQDDSYVDLGTTPFMAVPYALHANNVSGLEYLDETNDETDNGGWRLIGRDPGNYGNIGDQAVDLSYSNSLSATKGATGNRSTALGINTEASGLWANAMGGGTTASGVTSTAMGYYTIASGNYSTAMGYQSTATGIRSTALGLSTLASGERSTTMGAYTKAESMNSTAIGSYNIGGGSPMNWVGTDPLFEVGNGESDGARSNALTILKNGLIGIDTNTPTADLHIKQSTVNSSGSGGIKFEASGSSEDYWKIYHSGIHLSFSENGTRFAYIQGGGSGSFITTSDKKFKNSISEINPVLNRVMSLKPSKYYYNHQKDKANKLIGLIAQEVQPLFPEIVTKSEDGSLGISYSTIGVIAIKAIQEQQKIIESQQKIIESQNKKNKILESRLEKVEQFIAQMSN